MRRIGKLLGGLVLAGMAAAGLPARGADDGQVAGDRPGLRADRQGRRHARGAGQAARHGGPRGGQAGLQPRDDQAARPARRGREDPRPRELTPARPRRVAGREVGARRCLPRLDGRPRVLGRPAVHPGRLPPLATADRGRTRSRRGSRRSPTSPTTPATRRPACRSSPPTPNATAADARPRSSAAPSCRSRTARPIAELAAKLSEEHKWLTPRELEEATDHRQGITTHAVHGLGQRAPGAAAAIRRQSAIRRAAHRAREAGGRGRHAADRPTRLTAESGSRPPG